MSFAGSDWAAHRVVWFLCTGEQPASHLDHKNRNRLDNRLPNLRPATPSQNQANSGDRGRALPKRVYATKSGRFRAWIQVNRRQRCLGIFNTAEEALEAYMRAAKQAFGEYARAA
jgi:hypothetical protein